MSENELVGRKRKLSGPQKLKLARFAYEKFIDLKARAAEAKAQAAVKAAFIKASAAVTPAEIKVLRKYKMVVETKLVRLPHHLNVTVGEKSFEVGDKTVVRPDSKTIHQPLEHAPFEPANIHEAISGKSGSFYQPRVTILDLGQSIIWPGDHLWKCFGDNGQIDDTTAALHMIKNHSDHLRIEGSQYLPDFVVKALGTYYQLADERNSREMELGKAASKLINACTHFNQIIEFWPEAKEIELELFEQRLPKAVSLVTISNEDKAALCSNMKARGVRGSELCSLSA